VKSEIKVPGPGHYRPSFSQIEPKSDKVSFALRAQQPRVSFFRHTEQAKELGNYEQLQSELGCCNRIMNYLSKQSFNDELCYPGESKISNPNERQPDSVPVRKFKESDFKPNNSVYIRVV
jgi:hypothetical protein